MRTRRSYHERVYHVPVIAITRLAAWTLIFSAAVVAGLPAAMLSQAPAAPARPFGTLREQAAMQQRWLEKRIDDRAARR